MVFQRQRPKANWPFPCTRACMHPKELKVSNGKPRLAFLYLIAPAYEDDNLSLVLSQFTVHTSATTAISAVDNGLCKTKHKSLREA